MLRVRQCQRSPGRRTAGFSFSTERHGWDRWTSLPFQPAQAQSGILRRRKGRSQGWAGSPQLYRSWLLALDP